MKSLVTLVLSLVQDIVVAVRDLVAGDVALSKGLRPLLASVVALAVAVLTVRLMAWGLGDALTSVVSRLLGAA